MLAIARRWISEQADNARGNRPARGLDETPLRIVERIGACRIEAQNAGRSSVRRDGDRQRAAQRRTIARRLVQIQARIRVHDRLAGGGNPAAQTIAERNSRRGDSARVVADFVDRDQGVSRLVVPVEHEDGCGHMFSELSPNHFSELVYRRASEERITQAEERLKLGIFVMLFDVFRSLRRRCRRRDCRSGGR